MTAHPVLTPTTPELDLAWHRLTCLASLGGLAMRQAYEGRLDIWEAEAPEHPKAVAFAEQAGLPIDEVLTALALVSGKSAPPHMFS